MRACAAGLVLGYAADRVFGDPARLHPVAGFGMVAQVLERRMYRDDRLAGAAYSAVLVGGAAVLGLVADRVTRAHPAARIALTGATTWAVLGGRSLSREAQQVSTWLDAGDLPAAREQLTHLVGRDPSGLGPHEISRATVESVAENTSDAVVAPLLLGAVGGTCGLVAYRAANTLDAMVGYRSARYLHFGWASARLDDLFNLAPARLSASLTVLGAPLIGGSRTAAWATWRRDGHRHPSPNAGPVEAAFAGALGVQLGGTNTYGERVEHRPTLGDGPAVRADDIARAVRLADLVSLGALAVSAAIAWSRPR